SCLNGYIVRADREKKEITLIPIEEAWGSKADVEPIVFKACGKITSAGVYRHKAGYALASLLAFPEKGIEELSSIYASSDWNRLIAHNLLVFKTKDIDRT